MLDDEEVQTRIYGKTSPSIPYPKHDIAITHLMPPRDDFSAAGGDEDRGGKPRRLILGGNEMTVALSRYCCNRDGVGVVETAVTVGRAKLVHSAAVCDHPILSSVHRRLHTSSSFCYAQFSPSLPSISSFCGLDDAWWRYSCLDLQSTVVATRDADVRT